MFVSRLNRFWETGEGLRRVYELGEDMILRL